jgi:hypothetical protein
MTLTIYIAIPLYPFGDCAIGHYFYAGARHSLKANTKGIIYSAVVGAGIANVAARVCLREARRPAPNLTASRNPAARSISLWRSRNPLSDRSRRKRLLARPGAHCCGHLSTWSDCLPACARFHQPFGREPIFGVRIRTRFAPSSGHTDLRTALAITIHLITLSIARAPSCASGTPPGNVKWLERETLKVLATPEMKEKLYQSGFQVRSQGADAAWARVTREIEMFKRIIDQAGIKKL